MKKLICMVLTVIMLLSTTAAFATPVAYDPDTVITKDNYREILTFYGLDPNALRKDLVKKGSSVTTVGELEKAMEELDNVPSFIVDKPFLPQTMAYTKEGKFRDISFWQNVLGNKAKFNPLTVYTGTKTIYRDTTYTNSLVITYNVTGSYYKNVVTVGPTLKYWTAAGGSGEAVNGNSSGTTYVWEITTRYYNTNQCINPSTTSSYLKHSYDYVVTAYISVLGQGLIPYKDTRITGYQTYDVSYI